MTQFQMRCSSQVNQTPERVILHSGNFGRTVGIVNIHACSTRTEWYITRWINVSEPLNLAMLLKKMTRTCPSGRCTSDKKFYCLGLRFDRFTYATRFVYVPLSCIFLSLGNFVQIRGLANKLPSGILAAMTCGYFTEEFHYDKKSSYVCYDRRCLSTKVLLVLNHRW